MKKSLKMASVFLLLVIFAVGCSSGGTKKSNNNSDNNNYSVKEKDDIDNGKIDLEEIEQEDTNIELEPENEISKETKNLTVYIVDGNNDKLKKEIRPIVVENRKFGWAVLRGLKETPFEKGYYSTIPGSIDFKGIVIEDGLATVDFDNNDINIGSSSEQIFVDSVILTLTKFESIERVKFLINGKEINSFGNLDYSKEFSIEDVKTPIDTTENISINIKDVTESKVDVKNENTELNNLNNDINNKKKMNLSVYVVDENAIKLKKETRPIEVEGKRVGWAVLQGLKETPNEVGYYNAVPDSITFNSLSIENKIAIVDFDSNGISFGTTGESIFVESVIMTLTNFKNVDGVRFVENGKPVKNFGHLDYSKVFSKEDVLYSDIEK